MEVKKLSEFFEIIEEAMVWGDRLVSRGSNQFISNLQSSAEKGG